MQAKRINRSIIATMLALVIMGGLAAQASTPMLVEGHSIDQVAAGNTIDARILASMDAATAAALIGALETRFAGRDVSLRMGKVQGERASLRDISLRGNAQVRLGEDAAWLPIRFEALYDTDTQAVLSPSIVLEGAGDVANSNRVAALPLPGLRDQVVQAMAEEFASQQVDVSLGNAQVIGNDGRRLVVRAKGIAQFDGTDTAPVTVRALYEQGTGRWLDAQYDFDVVGS